MAYNTRQQNNADYHQLNEDLRSGSIRPCYLLFGTEEYLKLSYKKRFRQLYGGDDGMAYTAYEGAPDIDGLLDTLNTVPFTLKPELGRLVIVSDSGWFTKSPPERVLSFIEDQKHYPDFSHLMFIEKETDKRSRLYKLLSKMGTAYELSAQDPVQLSQWAARYLGTAGKKIRENTMARFIGTVGQDMNKLSQEMEKLIAYTGSRDVITEQDIEVICSQNIEDRVFDMIAEMSAGHREKALRLYRDLVILQEAPMKILSLMRRNFNQLLLTKEAAMKELGSQEGAAYAGMSPWVYRRLLDQTRGYSVRELEGYIGECLKLDEMIKSGNITDRMAVELLLSMHVEK